MVFLSPKDNVSKVTLFATTGDWNRYNCQQSKATNAKKHKKSTVTTQNKKGKTKATQNNSTKPPLRTKKRLVRKNEDILSRDFNTFDNL